MPRRIHLPSHPRADSVLAPKCDRGGVPQRKATAMPTDVLIINLAVLFAVLEADLGRRKVTAFRILRPVLLAAGIVPLLISHPSTSGNGEVLELALTGLGILLGIAAAGGLMKVSYDTSTRQAVSTSGAAYGIFWTVVIGARLLFTYGANHWYASQLGHWMATNAITVDALTDALIFMALAMAITRSIRLAVGRAQARPLSVNELAV